VRDLTAEQELERLRTDFVATASHELRTPVTAVYGAAQTLRQHGSSLSPERQRRLMQMIEQETERLAQITDQMLVVAQSDRGELRLDETECDLVELCRDVVGQERFRHAEQFTMLLVSPTRMDPLRCDGPKLRQVVLNLVENAVKYSPEGGRIQLRVEDGGERVRVHVTDSGLGIPAGEQERIFEKFYRADAQMTRGIGGSGLGLYISRQIVEQMGGTLSVRSEPGRGSTFTVELPR
jgi:two-component system phosphate regulon sensor histidine kinase PhoR